MWMLLSFVVCMYNGNHSDELLASTFFNHNQFYFAFVAEMIRAASFLSLIYQLTFDSFLSILCTNA